MSRVLLFFILSLLASVGSINGRTPCGSTPTDRNYNDQMESMEDSQRELGRMGLECNTGEYSTAGSGSGSGSAASAVLGLFVLLFIIFGVATGIWCVCVKRQKAVDAANDKSFSGQVVGAQVAHGNDLKTVQKGDPGLKV